MAARAINSATIAFGMVAIPVKIYSSSNTTARKSFNWIAPSGERASVAYLDSGTGEIVDRADLLKGYEYTKGEWAVFTPEEVKGADAPENSKRLEIAEFVPEIEVARTLVAKTYYLAADKGGERAYTLLHRSLVETGTVAIAKWVYRGVDYLIAVRADERGYLLMEQLKFADEYRPVEDVPLAADETSDEEVELAKGIIDGMVSDELDLAKYENEREVRLDALVQSRLAGETEAPDLDAAAGRKPAEDPLLAALKASAARADA